MLIRKILKQFLKFSKFLQIKNKKQAPFPKLFSNKYLYTQQKVYLGFKKLHYHYLIKLFSFKVINKFYKLVKLNFN